MMICGVCNTVTNRDECPNRWQSSHHVIPSSKRSKDDSKDILDQPLTGRQLAAVLRDIIGDLPGLHIDYDQRVRERMGQP